jgi:protocatechuate 3,4-dioxygenase alpha subunit
MSAESVYIPASSQTVGPYFRIGLEYLIDRASPANAGEIIIHGSVFDGNGAPVSDAMLEFWSPACGVTVKTHELPLGFMRVCTDLDGAFTAALPRPRMMANEEGLSSACAPHFVVLVFARGLLRHLISRVYLDDEAANALDPVLLSVPEARIGTLVAKHEGAGVFRWDVILQGANETVFFAW